MKSRKKQQAEAAPAGAAILKFIRGRRYRPMTAREMADALGVAETQRDLFLQRIRELELAGELVEVKKGRLADPARLDLVVGTLLCNRAGFGFIRPACEAEGEDLYVSGQNIGAAMHGDLVVARVPPAARKPYIRRGRRRDDIPANQVKIVSVLKRARTEVVGTFRHDRKVRYVVPDDPRLFQDVVVAAEDTHGARHDEKVSVRILAWPSRHISPTGEVVEVFGPRGQLEAELRSVVREFDLRPEFPKAVLHAAERLPKEVRRRDLQGREDLTSELILTIDPEDARDFDDAVSLRRLSDGGWELGVHIADVSHYVRTDREIDREALARGTSVYLPGQVIPMLPETLSNGLCSLRPNEVRLTKSVRMRCDAEGRLRDAKIFRSFIRSVRRFSYKEVLAVIEGGTLPADEEKLHRTLLRMHEFAQLLRQRRQEAGMLELDIPEAHIVTDEKGRTVGVELVRGDAAHRLIEQFMLAANEAVANHLIRRRLPYLCRAHDEPEPKAIAEFSDAARTLGHRLPSPGTRDQIRRFLKRLKEKPEAPVLHYLLLRSMKAAVYSAEDAPHYAIAAPHYLHFTSPIRRYPDLLVHRILDEASSGRLKEAGRREYWKDNLPAWAQHASETERNAQSAERTLTNRRLIDFVATQRGTMKALITAVENYGLRLQLCDFLLDGVIRMSALSDGFYRVDRRRGALVSSEGGEYRVGQTLDVRVQRYDELKRQIEFEPILESRRT